MYLKNGDMWEGMMHDVHCINCTTTMSDYSREKVEAKWNLRSLPNEKGTGRRVDLLCAASQDPATGEIVMTPLAQMFMGNPYDMFDPPESEGHEETACRGLPN